MELADFSNLKNTDVIKNLLNNLIDLSGKRTEKGYAISSIQSVINQLQDKYDFLKNIEINDNRFVENEEIVSVMTDLNDVDSTLVGSALNDLVIYTNNKLGKNAGHFFIKELKRTIGGDYNTIMKEMGVDLGLMQLEKEIRDLSTTINKK